LNVRIEWAPIFSNRISEQLVAEAIALFAVSAAEMPSHDFY
jgi:hypothetical protein